MVFANPDRAPAKAKSRASRISALIADANELYSIYSDEHDPSDGSHPRAQSNRAMARAFGVFAGGSGDTQIYPQPGSFNVEYATETTYWLNVRTPNAVSITGQNSLVLATYLGPNGYRASSRATNNGVDLRIFNSSGYIPVSDWTEDDAVSF